LAAWLIPDYQPQYKPPFACVGRRTDRPVKAAASCAGAQLFTQRIGDHMNLHLGLTPLISLIAGILILIMPKLLNFIVAAYLIVIGLVGLFGTGAMRIN
jgi:hypothetical protein